MGSKLEKLSSDLFQEIDEKTLENVIGGQTTAQTSSTFVGKNGDSIICGEDYRGKSCDKVVLY